MSLGLLVLGIAIRNSVYSKGFRSADVWKAALKRLWSIHRSAGSICFSSSLFGICLLNFCVEDQTGLYTERAFCFQVRYWLAFSVWRILWMVLPDADNCVGVTDMSLKIKETGGRGGGGGCWKY